MLSRAVAPQGRMMKLVVEKQHPIRLLGTKWLRRTMLLRKLPLVTRCRQCLPGAQNLLVMTSPCFLVCFVCPNLVYVLSSRLSFPQLWTRLKNSVQFIVGLSFSWMYVLECVICLLKPLNSGRGEKSVGVPSQVLSLWRIRLDTQMKLLMVCRQQWPKGPLARRCLRGLIPLTR